MIANHSRLEHGVLRVLWLCWALTPSQIFWDVHFLGCAAEGAEMCVLCTDSHRVGNLSYPTRRKQLFCSLRVVPCSL